MNVLIYPLILSLLFFVFILLRDRRTLFLGVFFVITSILLLAFLIVELEKHNIIFSDSPANRIIFIPLALLVLIIMIGPTVITFSFIANGIRLIRKEGFAFRNLLSLGLGIFLLIYFIFGNALLDYVPEDSVTLYILQYISLVIAYFMLLASAYTISSWLNFFNLKNQKLDYIVVLGAGLKGDKPTPLLKTRIDKGIKLYKDNPGSKLIMSGGKGDDEVISEAQAMKNYALEKGIAEKDIIIENKSTNTQENLHFSKALMDDHSKFAIATNYYHLFRALLIAKEEKIKCIGYGAKTKFYFSLNAFVREFIGYLYIKRNLHLIFIGLLTLIYVAFVIAANSFPL